MTRAPGEVRADRTARAAASFFGAVVGASDLLPPRIRYGYVHRLTRLAFRQPMVTVGPDGDGTASRSFSARPHAVRAAAAVSGDAISCALLAGELDVGGIGSVVELLAAGFPRVGLRPVVVCTSTGARTARLEALGVEVVVATGTAEARRLLARIAPTAVQLHGAPPEFEDAALELGIPVVPVLHNTEIHYSRTRWGRFGRVLERSPRAIAVSELVRDFHAGHVAEPLRDRIRVVPNAVPEPAATTEVERRSARARLGAALGKDFAADVLFVSLARYDSQKNVAGLVAAFLAEVSDPGVHLVIAGEPSDWAELRRAEAIRRTRPGADRVSLLGTSDARTLLAAADAFVLDSFFEGWPVAATEAAAMGLPLILSDFGGARELVARDPEHSELVANPSGSAAGVSDARVARARRRARRQPNAGALGAAVEAVAGRVRRGDRPTPITGGTLMNAMLSGHAAVIAEAVAAAEPVRSTDSEGVARWGG